MSKKHVSDRTILKLGDTGELIAGKLNAGYRDKEGKESDSEHKSQDDISASHVPEGSTMGCIRLTLRTARSSRQSTEKPKDTKGAYV